MMKVYVPGSFAWIQSDSAFRFAALHEDGFGSSMR